jgi:hypothetical protein
MPSGSLPIRVLDALLDGFVHTDFVYLAPDGRWERNPVTLRDRISNEILFRLWLARRNPGWPEPARRLIDLLLLTPGIHAPARRESVTGGMVKPGFSEMLDALEVLFAVVEYEVHAAGAARHVAEWDYAGKLRKTTCEIAAARAIERLGGLSALADLLRRAGLPIVDETVHILAEEEELRWEMDSRAPSAAQGQASGEIAEAPGEYLRESLPVAAGRGGSLVRPCVEILLRSDLPVSTGIQYQVSDVLGRLKDPRTMTGMLAALELIDYGHTGIRSNLIYALGNLKETACLDGLASILGGPEFVMVDARGGSTYRQPLHEEKCEAIWAIGRLGPQAYDLVPTLAACAGISDRDVGLHLAWALGEIGSRQAARPEGMKSRITETLTRLIGRGDLTLFEEAAAALKRTGTPCAPDALQGHDLGTIPVLALKPSSTGLYELSETILHLVRVRRPVVMAVTGDSGTGKTYFCQTLAEGFGDVGGDEITYLMRDRVGDRTLDRIVGLEWLRAHVQPRFYEPYPIPEDQDDPDAFFEEFVGSLDAKKLIIVDGWRDQAYFNRVIEIFYERGLLDILVHFRTTFSTRRLNLETREASLERVKMHLPLVEQPVIEDTGFYREGSVLIYNLDNSISSRLDRSGIREVFNRRKVDRWEDLIRIGAFPGTGHLPGSADRTLGATPVDLGLTSEPMRIIGPEDFKPREAAFIRRLADDLGREPHLLQTVTTGDVPVTRIAFYTQGQIACGGRDGSVGVLVGFNDRAFYARPHGSAVACLAVAGHRLYSAGGDGKIKVTAFDRNTITELGAPASPVTALAACRDGRLISGHLDGSVRIWDTKTATVTVADPDAGPVSSLAVDRRGWLYLGGTEGRVCVVDPRAPTARLVDLSGAPVTVVAPYIDGRVAIGVSRAVSPDACGAPREAEILLADPASGRSRVLRMVSAEHLISVHVYFDGRLVVGFSSVSESGPRGGLAVVAPGPDGATCAILGGHGAEIRDCLTMGPRIITCGSENDDRHTLKIWGTASYVAAEHAKASLLPEGMPRPPYYRSLF